MISKTHQYPRIFFSIKSIIRALIFISFIVYPIHIFIGYIFSNSPLIIWRQLISFILIILPAFLIITRMKTDGNGLIFLTLITISTVLFFYSIIRGYSLLRVGYAFFSYVGLSSALLFYKNLAENGKLAKFQRLIFLIAIFCSIGLLTDYFTDFLSRIPRAEANNLEDISFGHLRRASFFFGASTLVFPFLSFSFISILSFYYKKLNSIRIWLLWLLLSVGLLVTVSRAGILAWIILSFLVLFVLKSMSLNVINVIKNFIIGLIVIAGIIFVLQNLLYQNEIIFDRLSKTFFVEEKSNSHRLDRWREGLLLFDFSTFLVLGHGLGSTMGQVQDSMDVHTHYESSFFQALYEGGFLGLMLRYLPSMVAFWYFFKNRMARLQFDLKLYVAWLFVYLFVIFLAPTAGAFHNQLVYFYVCGLIIQKSGKR